VLETWIPRLGVRGVVVADDEAAGSPLARAAMTLCVPPELPVRVVPLSELDAAGLAALQEPVLVLVRDVASLVEATRHGLTPARAARLNLGNVHYSAGRKAVTPSVFLTAAELAQLQALGAAGFQVEAQAIPSDAPVELDALARKFASAK
jgi:PTS system N-acetylgalactosamine-specific IIB component